MSDTIAPKTVIPTIFDFSSPGRQGVRFPEPDVPAVPLPENLTRKVLPLPELAEVDVIRHYTNLSQLNPGPECSGQLLNQRPEINPLFGAERKT